MKALISTSLVLVMFAGTAHAGQEVLKGAGVRTCGQFATEYRENPTLTEQLYFTWAQGFMTGLNVSTLLSGKGQWRDINARTVEDEEAYLRDYCDRHPLEEYEMGVLDLWSKLPFARKPS